MDNESRIGSSDLEMGDSSRFESVKAPGGPVDNKNARSQSPTLPKNNHESLFQTGRKASIFWMVLLLSIVGTLFLHSMITMPITNEMSLYDEYARKMTSAVEENNNDQTENELPRVDGIIDVNFDSTNEESENSRVSETAQNQR